MQEKNAGDKIEHVLQEDIWGSIKGVLDHTLFTYGSGQGEVQITIGLILLVIFVFVLTSFILRLIKSLIARRLEEEDKHKFVSIFKFVRYVIYLAVVLITLSSVGVNISILLTASAALFVGIGLALQEFFQDIIGGIFIILDKSLLVGDIIEMEDRVGRIFEIKLRTTRALTRDDKVMIIPNHKFMSDVVYNYTQNHKTTREAVKVGVAYGSDTNLVRSVLLEVAKEQKGILKTPNPFVLFEDFGDSALLFGIYFYLSDSFVDPKVKSEMRFRIDKKFRENKISIPFPQRDVHMFYPPKSDAAKEED